MRRCLTGSDKGDRAGTALAVWACARACGSSGARAGAGASGRRWLCGVLVQDTGLVQRSDFWCKGKEAHVQGATCQSCPQLEGGREGPCAMGTAMERGVVSLPPPAW